MALTNRLEGGEMPATLCRRPRTFPPPLVAMKLNPESVLTRRMCSLPSFLLWCVSTSWWGLTPTSAFRHPWARAGWRPRHPGRARSRSQPGLCPPSPRAGLRLALPLSSLPSLPPFPYSPPGTTDFQVGTTGAYKSKIRQDLLFPAPKAGAARTGPPRS